MTALSVTLITKDRALALIDEVVAERGEDYRYKDHYDYCMYATVPSSSCDDPACDCGRELAQPEPACVVGVALAKVGVDTGVLADLGEGAFGLFNVGLDNTHPAFTDPPAVTRSQEYAAWTATVPLTGELRPQEALRGEVEATEAALRVFEAAQAAQDFNLPYGQVKRIAHAVADALPEDVQ